MDSELPNLQQLVKMTPGTATGRVRAAWAVISANLATGKKLWEVYEAAERDGLDVPYAQFKIYVQRLRKRDLRSGLQAVSTRSRGQMVVPEVGRQGKAQSIQPQASAGVKSDPLRNVRELRAKKNSFEYNPFPPKGLTL